jgi:general secretion pathway protein N
MRDIASRLSSIKPLGAYDFTMDWRGQQAQVSLKSVHGPLLLSGAGAITNGRLRFSGKAEAAAGQDERLANLLNLLGQRRMEGNKTIIALEFK